ncbi:MAG: hypothetical protein H6702_14780 [Myxococcales bacterium]|nr:hypothetical protein [Myxococcales bacterium]
MRKGWDLGGRVLGGLVLAGLAMTAGCKQAPAPTAPKVSAGSAAPSQAATPAEEVRALLVKVAERCQSTGVSVRDFQRCTDWRRQAGRLRHQLGRYDPLVEDSIKPFLERVGAAEPLLADADGHRRAAARATLELGLNIAQYKPVPQTQAWVKALADRVVGASDPDEQVDLLRIVGNHGGAEQKAQLIQVGRTAKAPDARAAAWTALGRCSPRGCAPDAQLVRDAWAQETDGKVKGALAALAGWGGLPEVLTWCDGPTLDDPQTGPGCRAALKRRGDVAALKLLSARARQLLGTAPGGEDTDRRVAGAVADLLPVADLPEAGHSVYELYHELLLQPRSALALGTVVSQLLVLKDKARAADAAVAAYERLAKVPKDGQGADHALFESRLRQVILKLGAGPRIGLEASDAHGHGPGKRGQDVPGGGHEGHGH